MRRVVLAACLLVGACSGGTEDASVDGPVVDLIPEAVEAVEAHYGAPQEYFEVSAGLDSVEFIVAVDGARSAEQGSLSSNGTFIAPIPVGEASGATFTADAIAFEADRIFEQVRAELGDPVIIDLAIQGGPDGGVIYDATIATDGGGVLLVLLAPDGTILGVQGE